MNGLSENSLMAAARQRRCAPKIARTPSKIGGAENCGFASA
jgi:hypothetical protein